MTEREAWLQLARAFSVSRGSSKRSETAWSGLCYAIERLRDRGKIDGESYDRMHAKIDRWVIRLRGNRARFAWGVDLTDEGDRKRVAFCREKARRLK